MFDDTVAAIIDRTPLVVSEPDEGIELVDGLDGRVDPLATSHCTGSDTEALLSDRFSGEFIRSRD